ncbi:MAG TPA: Nif3-like dinuclear metal center hexameric protein, partial [bacterium]
MKIAELIEFIESWAPPGSALEKDNPGLQVGDAGATLKNILLTLDVTEAVLDEAIEKGANLILSHHPLIFEPLRKVDIEARTGKLIGKALQHG